MGYKYYYSLEECARAGYNRPFNPITHKDSTQPNFKDVVDAYYGTIPDWAKTDTTEFTYLNELWQRIRHMFDKVGTYFWVSDNEYDVTVAEDLDNLHKECDKRMRDLIETVYESKDYYIALITNQATLSPETLDSIEIKTENWVNDTPQNTGTYTTEDYTSNYSKTISTTPLGTAVDKLDIVAKSNIDYYERWLQLFKRFRLFD